MVEALTEATGPLEAGVDVLIVEDEPVQRQALAKWLTTRAGFTVRSSATAEGALRQFRSRQPDVLITDHRLPGDGGHELLLKVKQDYPDTAVIVATGNGNIDDAVVAMRDGAADYLRKPIDMEEMELVVRRSLERRSLDQEIEEQRARDMAANGIDSIDDIVGSSWAMRKLRSLLEHVAGLEKRGGGGMGILLTGEPGTGKGMAARAIHQASARRGGPFIEVNCTAIPELLLEADLMGYERGGFAEVDKVAPGLFEAARGGTLFLDAVADIPGTLQAKLLQVLDTKLVRRLGGSRMRPIDVTIIAATDRNLEEEVQAGRFREDLYHRLSVLRVNMPPVREREGDALQLAQHFLQRHARRSGMSRTVLARSAVQTISGYDWPGNVREIRQRVERAVRTAPGPVYDACDLGLPGKSQGRGAVTAIAPQIDANFGTGTIPLEGVERALIRQALAHSGHHTTVAAKLLGISRHTLLYRLRKHKLR